MRNCEARNNNLSEFSHVLVVTYKKEYKYNSRNKISMHRMITASTQGNSLAVVFLVHHVAFTYKLVDPSRFLCVFLYG